MFIVVVGSSPEGENVVQRPRELVTRVGIHRLEQSKTDPECDGEQVQVTREVAPDHGNSNSTHAQKRNLDWVSVFCGHSKWSSIAVMLFMDVLVESAVVQASVEPVMPRVLQDEEKGQVEENLAHRRERNSELDSNLLGYGVEKPDGERFHEEVRSQYRLETLPLLLVGRKLRVLDFVLSEVRNSVYDEPGKTTAKVHHLVHDKEKETRCKKVIIDVVVVGAPYLFNHAELSHLVEVSVGVCECGDVAETGVVVIDLTEVRMLRSVEKGAHFDIPDHDGVWEAWEREFKQSKKKQALSHLNDARDGPGT